MSSSSRVALVTGGASGIGFAFSQALAEAGYRVAIADLRAADDAAARLRGEGHEATGVSGDITRPADADRMVAAAVEAFGGLDVLVNNAALFTTLKPKPFDQLTHEEWMKVMEVNTFGPFNCARAAVPAMVARGGGRIVNVASVAALKGTPMMLHYVASKGAVIAFTRSLSREVGPRNITVNAIAPGFTMSDGVLQSGMADAIGEGARRLGRSIARDQVPADLVGALLFLAAENADFITGQTLAIDGGSVFL